jgi:hypothetical protein
MNTPNRLAPVIEVAIVWVEETGGCDGNDEGD